MKKKKLLISSLLMLISVSMAHAQKAYTYVQQDGTKIDKLGTAAFDLSASPTVEFVDGKAVMTIGGNTVAKLLMSDKGQLAVEFSTTLGESDLNKVTKDYTTPFATLYSPFQLTVPSGDVEVYAPTYDATKHELVCNSTTKIAEGTVIPAETAVLLKNAGTIDFSISAGASTAEIPAEAALKGSSLLINASDVEVADGNTLYTLGHEATDNTKYGFFSYTGTELNPGLAWLVEPTFTAARQYVAFNFDGETTGIVNADVNPNPNLNGKFIENGRVVIVKNQQKYNLNGQEVK